MSERRWIIRPFTPADQPMVKALVLAGLAEHWGELDPTLNSDLNDIAAHYGPQNSHTFVAVLDDLIVGTGTIREKDPTTVELVRVSVSSARRGQGLGKGLVRHLISIAREREYTSLVCETTDTWQDAIGLYLACGFTITAQQNGDVYFRLELS
jgi:putative acetyltransferase